MEQYLDLLQKILDEGQVKDDRTGTGTKSFFGHQMRFDLNQGFPIFDNKEDFFKGVVYELLWFLDGSTDNNALKDNGVHIWDEWETDSETLAPFMDSNGEIGLITIMDNKLIRFSKLLIKSEAILHLEESLSVLGMLPTYLMKAFPLRKMCERKMALAPCHAIFQFFVSQGKLSCQLYQRSCDTFLGLGFNIASYSLLTHMIAQQCDLDVGEFIWTGGDVHLYLNHLEQANEQLQREPYPLPNSQINRKPASIFEYKYEDFELINYESHPHISAPISI